MPGAGSLVAANHLYNVAPRDGTVLGRDQFAGGDPSAAYRRSARDSIRTHFRWIGSALREYHTGVAWHTTPVKTFADVFTHELLVAGSGGSTNLYPVFVAGLLGARAEDDPGLSGHAQRHAGDGARRGRRQFRHQLGEPEGDAGYLDHGEQDPRVRADRAHAPSGAAGRAAGSTTSRATTTIAPRWTSSSRPGFRPAVPDAAGRAGRHRRDPAHRVRGDDERSGIPGRRGAAARSISISPAAPRYSRWWSGCTTFRGR